MSDSRTYYHGTKANLRMGDLIEPGNISNFGKRKRATFVYLTATLDAAIWGAELAVGPGRGKIYIVQPTGRIEDDPNLTDKKFPGNPTKSYRSRQPFRIVGELANWEGHSPERLNGMLERLEKLKELGVEASTNDQAFGRSLLAHIPSAILACGQMRNARSTVDDDSISLVCNSGPRRT